MSLLYFGAGRIYLRVLLWSVLFHGLLCDDAFPGQTRTELLALGTPPVPGSIVTSRITITTTVTYRPSLIPGNSQYTLVGCYSEPSGDEGQIFGSDEFDVYLDKAPPAKLTMEGCLQSCGSAAPPSSRADHYAYAGLRNGSDCICGFELSTNAHKLSVNDCIMPCSGDRKLSCGGRNKVAIYSLVSGDPNSRGSRSGTTKQPVIPVSTSTIDSQNEDSLFLTAASNETPRPSPAPESPISTPTIAAVTGSLSGAIVIGAGLFLWYRARKHKKRAPDTYTKSMRERRGKRNIPNLILGRGSRRSNTANVAVSKHQYKYDDSGSSGTEEHNRGDLMPSPPTLESQVAASENSSLYGALMGEARSRPASSHANTQTSGASSAVQWRRNSTTSGEFSPQQTVRERTLSSSAITNPPPVAKADGLGERAWHRRKLSTPYQPPQSVGLGTGATAGISVGAGVEGTRGNIARRGPPSGPPGWIPPSPPSRPRVRASSRSRPTVVPEGPRSAKRPGEICWPLPPRGRSFDAAMFGPALGGGDEQDVPSVSGTGAGLIIASIPSKKSIMSHANASTPSLGRFGSLSKRRRAGAESPVLGWRTPPKQGPGDASPRETRGDDGRQPTIPILPPVAPGERFDHRRWRGTVYVPSTKSEKQGERGVGQIRSGESSPVSVSSTGTSILFDSLEFDRQL